MVILINTSQIYPVGFELLDQTQPQKSGMCNKDEFNPSIEAINRELKKIKIYTQVSGFTLTLKKKYHTTDDKWMHRQIIKAIKKSHIWKNKKYIIFPEYTKAGNLHYHGIMYDEYPLEVMRCIKWWRHKYGFAKPELKLKSVDNWIKYITKEHSKTGLWTIHNIRSAKNDMELPKINKNL